MFWKTFRKEAGISQLLPYANSRGLFSIFRKANDQGLPLNPSMAYSNVPSSLLLPPFFFFSQMLTLGKRLLSSEVGEVVPNDLKVQHHNN